MTDDLWIVLADPNRRLILDALRTGDRSVGELVDRLAIQQSGVSRHLRILRDHGLVDVRPKAQQRIYHLNARPLRDLSGWLEPYREFWHTRLDALESHLESHLETKEDG